MEITKVKRTIKTIIADLIVIALGLSYVFYRALAFETKQLDPLTMLVDGLFAIAVGVAIKQTLGEKGFIKGYDSEEYKTETEKNNVACNDSIEYIDKVDLFEQEVIDERKWKYRKTQLQSARLRYQDFFETNGDPKDIVVVKKWKVKKDYIPSENERVLDLFQRHTLNRCYKVKIKVLNLFSEYSKDTTNFSDKETSDKQQRARMFSKNLLSAVAFTLAGLYFTAKIVQLNWGDIIFASVQVCGFIATGITQMYQNINFIKVDKVNTLKEKTKRLSIFINNCKKGKYDEKLVEEQHN